MTREEILKRIKREAIAEPFKQMSAVAYELTHDGEGWSVNAPWKLGDFFTYTEAEPSIEARLNVFIINYLDGAIELEVSFEGDEFDIYVNINGVPFLELGFDK